jgi:ribonuclease E
MSDPAPQLPNTPNPQEPTFSSSPAEDGPDQARKPRRRGSRGGRNRRPRPADEPTSTDEPEARRPRVGDTLPAPASEPASDEAGERSRRRRRGGRGRSRRGDGGPEDEGVEEPAERRRGRERNGRPVGRYLMVASVGPKATQVAVLEGRSLIEHYVSRPQDDATEIHGNIYVGRVQNVLPGMEAAFLDIGTPKNAVLYRGDLHLDAADLDVKVKPSEARIEQLLKAKQTIICQVTKNPIGAKGARLTQEVSIPGRFVVLIPNSSTYGISKRLGDDERKRLRSILDKIKPAQHGLIVRTAAEGASRDELERDVTRLLDQWERIETAAAKAQGPTLLYREPDLAVRVIREEFNADYRGIVIDDRALYEEVRDYVEGITPELADRVQFHDRTVDPLPLFELHHVHEQLHKALERKVWLPSGGSLIIERTEALTVIDVNTGKNVGKSNLEDTVFANNLEAAKEVARHLRLRDIGGIIVIDFIDMEIRANREEVVRVFRDALARDKTRTQVFEISDLGLVEMTRKRIGEGLLESMADTCPVCEGRGVIVDRDLLNQG